MADLEDEEVGPPPSYYDSHSTILTAPEDAIDRLAEDLRANSGPIEEGKEINVYMGSVNVHGGATLGVYSEYTLLISTNRSEYKSASNFSLHGLRMFYTVFRYSEFLSLYDVLAACASKPLPPCPKKVPFSRFTEDVIRSRMNSFHEIIEAIIDDDVLLTSRETVFFFWPPKSFNLQSLIFELIPRTYQDIGRVHGESLLRNRWQELSALLAEPLPLVSVGMGAYVDWSSERSVGSALTLAAGGFGGRVAGGSASVALGTLILPGVGTVGLGVVGAGIGSVSGMRVAKKYARKKAKKVPKDVLNVISARNESRKSNQKGKSRAEEEEEANSSGEGSSDERKEEEVEEEPEFTIRRPTLEESQAAIPPRRSAAGRNELSATLHGHSRHQSTEERAPPTDLLERGIDKLQLSTTQGLPSTRFE